MTFRIALAQCESAIGSAIADPKEANFRSLESAVIASRDAGADLVLFGEMFLTGYRTDEYNPTWAIDLEDADDALERLVELALEHRISLLVGSATKRPSVTGEVRNSALLVNGNGLVASYDKLHVGRMTMPDGAVVDERAWFAPGSEIPVWSTPWGAVGPQICYDSWFPEVSRVQSINGAGVLLNLTASISGSEESWSHLRFARAFENASWYVTCSTVGNQKGDTFVGGSAVIDPTGRTVAEAAFNREDLVFADIDPELAFRVRAQLNTFAARRPETYGAIARTNDGP